MKNDVEIDYDRDSVVPRHRFSFLSHSFLQISLNPFNVRKLNPLPQPTPPLHAYLLEMRGHG